MIADRLAKLQRRERVWLTFALVLASVWVLDWLVVHPILRKCHTLEAGISQSTEALQVHRAVLSTRPVVDQEFDAIRTQLGDPVPLSEAIDLMKGEIDGMAKKNDVVLRAMKHREPRRTAYYDELAVEIGDFEADEDSLLRFLHGLRSAPGTFKVTRLKINPDREGKLVTGSLTITKVMMPGETITTEG